MRAELLQSVHVRIQAIAVGDTEPVLAPEAFAEADQLPGFLGTPEGPDFQVLHAVGHADISRLRLRDAELAYLSACSTARGSQRLADEAIHIASAFQLAGYRHVVATLWPVLDSTAATVTAGFYTRLRHGASPAEALHGVIRQLRAAQPLTPSAWAGYVHAGP